MTTDATDVGIQYSRSWNGYYVRKDGVYVGQVWMNQCLKDYDLVREDGKPMGKVKGRRVIRGWSATNDDLKRVGGVFSTRQKAAQALVNEAKHL